MGIPLDDKDVAFRCSLISTDGDLSALSGHGPYRNSPDHSPEAPCSRRFCLIGKISFERLAKLLGE